MTRPAIPLGDDYGPSTPVLKRRRLGEQYAGMLANVEKRQRRDATGATIVKADGRPSHEEVLTLVTLSSTMVAGIGENDAMPVVGDVVRLIVRGGGYGAWIEAQKVLGRRPQVGDVVTLAHDHAIVYSMAGTPQGNPMRTQAELDAFRTSGRPGTVGIYGPVSVRPCTPAEEGQYLDAAIEAHYAAQRRKADPIPATGSTWGGDDAPF